MEAVPRLQVRIYSFHLSVEFILTCVSAARGWDIDAALQAAAAFPSHCAQYPQRTTALLTKYEALPSYHTSALALLNPPKYDNAITYTSMLLDDFMDLKALWKRAKAVGKDMDGYAKSGARDAYDVTRDGLKAAVEEIRSQMDEIKDQVDEINLRPEEALSEAIFGASGRKLSRTPAEFAQRLPDKKPVLSL